MEVKITITDGGVISEPPQVSREGTTQVQAQPAVVTIATPETIATKAAELGAINAGPAPSFMGADTQLGAPAPFVTGTVSETGIGPGMGTGAPESAGAAPSSGQFMETFIASVSQSGGKQ